MNKVSQIKYQMRQNQWEIKDHSKMEQFLDQAEVGRLGLYDGEDPYIVPFNFAYKNNRIFMHSALKGRKLEIMKKFPRVCFECDEFIEYDPVKQFTSYRSVFCFGNIRILDSSDTPEYIEALEAINQKYEPGAEMSCKSGALVLILDIETMTGREKLSEQ